jgi:spore germination protein KC
MIKKLIFIIIIIFNIFVFNGCWSYIEIDDQYIMTGIAVDKGTNGKKYHVTVEIINNNAGTIETGPKASIAEADGDTIISAVRNTIEVSSKRLYTGHCRIFILSEDIAKEGIKPLLDIVLRDHELRKNIDFVIAKKNTAKEILKQKGIVESLTMYGIADLLDNNEKSLSQTERARASHLMNTLGTDAASPVAPAFDVESTKEYNTYKLTGTAVFNKDKLIGFLNNEESVYFLMIVDKLNGGNISTKINDKNDLYVGAEVFDNKTGYKQNYKDGKLTFYIKTVTTVGISEIEKDINKSEFEKIKNLIENNIKNNISNLIKKVQTEYCSDIFGFSNDINDKNPNLWKKIKNNWYEIFRNMEINVTSEIKIRGTGTAKETMEKGD